MRHRRGELSCHESSLLEHNRFFQVSQHSGKRKDEQLWWRLQVSSQNWPVRRWVYCLPFRFLPHFLNLFHLQLIYFSSLIYFRFLTQTNDSIPADINECAEGTDDCNRTTQLCLNMRGSYKCKERVGDKCLTGLKYNSETKLCEGACRLIHF